MKSNFRSLILASAVLASAALATTAAMAENHVNVPFSFAIAGKTLPAGHYSIERNQARTFVTVTNKDIPASFAMVLAPGAPAQNENSLVMRFEKCNQSYTLESIRIGSQITPQKKTSNRTEHQPVEIVSGQ